MLSLDISIIELERDLVRYIKYLITTRTLKEEMDMLVISEDSVCRDCVSQNQHRALKMVLCLNSP